MTQNAESNDESNMNLDEKDLNTYAGIAEYYDTLMTAGYYNYDEISKTLNSIIGQNKKILELGVGTGLVAEKLLELNSDLDFTGIDNTETMIDQAKKRLGTSVDFVLHDITTVNLENKFEVAFSVGGCWYFIDNGDKLDFCSHIDDLSTSKQGLINVINHLEPGGLLVFALQPVHKNYSKQIKDGLTYTQEIFYEPSQFTKRYLFEKNGKIVAEQFYSYLLFQQTEIHDFFAKQGMKPVGLDANRKFFTYEKVK